MPVKKLLQELDRRGVEYVTIRHSPAYTAQAIAACAHVSDHELAKTVMIKIDGRMAMAVLPANEQLDMDLVGGTAGATRVELASEREFEGWFRDCEIGAMPPFGNLYGLDVYVTESLTDNAKIAFNAGNHRELIELKYDDFAQIVRPIVLHSAALMP